MKTRFVTLILAGALSAACTAQNPIAPSAPSAAAAVVAPSTTSTTLALTWTPYTGPRAGCIVRSAPDVVPDRDPDSVDRLDAETLRVGWLRESDLLHAEFRLQDGSWRVCYWDRADA